MKYKDDYDMTVHGHETFNSKGWLKYHPLMIDKISIEAALIFGVAVNVENYLLSNKLGAFKKRKFSIVFENSYIYSKLKFSPYQVRKGLTALIEKKFIKIMPSGSWNKRIIKVQWDVVIENLIEWRKKEIEDKNSRKEEKEMDEMNEDFFDVEEEFGF